MTIIRAKSKKKNRKLLLQVGFVIIPLFLMMIAAVAHSMYRSIVNSVLESQNTRLADYLDDSFTKSMLSKDRFFYDFALEHPQLYSKELSIPMEESSLSYYNRKFSLGITEEKYEEILNNLYTGDSHWNAEWLKTQPENVQMYCVATYFGINLSIRSYDTDVKRYNSLFLIDLREGSRGFVYFESNNSDGNRKLGDRLELDLSDHPALKSLAEDPRDEIVYEKATNFIRSGSQYIGYMPFYQDGEVYAVLGIAFNWSSLNDIMMISLRNAATVGIGGMIVLMIALIVVLYRMAIKPVGRLQNSVCEYIGTKDSKKIISDMEKVKNNNEVGLLSDNIAELAREIDEYTAENIRLAGERERVAAELDMAKNIQAGQIPSSFPAFPDRTDFEIYASMTPAKEVGGDFYDFFLIDEDHLALVIADVSGKGIPAALFMMMSKMLINNFASMGLEPAEVLRRANEKICENNEQKMFVTVWLGILEISTGKIIASNAGHEYPIIKQPDGSFELFKDKHSFVVGGDEGMKFRQYEFTLGKGGTLFVYTDGVPEATDSEENMYGTDRLVKVLNSIPGASPQEILETVHRSVNEFVGNAPQFDDLTMLCIELKK